MLPYLITSLMNKKEGSTSFMWLIILADNKFMPCTYPTYGSETASIFSTVPKLSSRADFSVPVW